MSGGGSGWVRVARDSAFRLPSSTSRAGFTLVELLLALLLVGTLFGGVYEVLVVARKAQRRDDDRVVLDQVGKACLERVVRDLESLVQEVSPYNTGLYAEDAETAAESGTVPMDWATFLCASNLVRNDALASETPTDVAGNPDLTEIQYFIGTDPDQEGQGLVRKVRRRLLDSLAADEEAWETQVLAEEVVGLSFRFFDGEAWTDGWDSESSETFPTAVEVNLVVARVRFEEGRWTSLLPDGQPADRKAFRAVVPLRCAPMGKKGAKPPEEAAVRG